MTDTPKCDAAIAAAESTPDWARIKLLRAQEVLFIARKERERWHGKFAIVTQENNALRKANRALRAEVAGLKIQIQKLTACANPPTAGCGCYKCETERHLKLFETAGSRGLFVDPCNCPRCTGRPPEPPLFEENECLT